MSDTPVASIILIRDGMVGLIFHQALNRWAPPGGKIEPGETPAQAAQRETIEETGYRTRLIFPPRPTDADIVGAEEISPPWWVIRHPPPHDRTAGHIVNHLYVGAPLGGPQDAPDALPFKWFTELDLRDRPATVLSFNLPYLRWLTAEAGY